MHNYLENYYEVKFLYFPGLIGTKNVERNFVSHNKYMRKVPSDYNFFS